MNHKLINGLLCIDIGNSTIGFGLFSGLSTSSRLLIKKIPAHPVRTAASYKRTIGRFIKDRKPNMNAVISSVVPFLNQPVVQAVTEICGRKPLIVSNKIKSGISFSISRPEKIGADRIANAVAAFHYLRKPAAVTDFGTATTITVVGWKCNFLGGIIMPGLRMMKDSLHTKTAKLPDAPLNKPKAALGKDTISAITSGIIYGTAGAVEAAIKNMERELGFKLQLVLTGGYAGFMSQFIKRKHRVMPDLTFEGMRLIYFKDKE